ncbi:hypothetical protein Sjap_006802 [Stephania japonica]|uniref:C2 domain-containing protein n=1 Tax=Stephania japonica TaxID=461633 RepID=A0AAP0K8C6_9MAGN
MALRKLDIIVRSASGLEDVRIMGQMRVFAVVALSDVAALATMQRTKVDMTGETNPVWNSNMSFSISHDQFQNHDLVFMLFCERTLLDDKLFGQVVVPLNVLRAEHSDAYTEVNYPVSNLKNCSHRGKLKFSYRFDDNLAHPRAPPNYAAMGAAGTSGCSSSSPPQPQRQLGRTSKLQLAKFGMSAISLLINLGQIGN